LALAEEQSLARNAQYYRQKLCSWALAKE